MNNFFIEIGFRYLSGVFIMINFSSSLIVFYCVFYADSITSIQLLPKVLSAATRTIYFILSFNIFIQNYLLIEEIFA